MKCIDEGHIYQLGNYQFPGSPEQEVSFIHKENGVLVRDGTTNEEVLAMLIDRMKYLNTKFACRENSIVITKLEESLMWLNKRTELRVSQGVESLAKLHKS